MPRHETGVLRTAPSSFCFAFPQSLVASVGVLIGDKRHVFVKVSNDFWLTINRHIIGLEEIVEPATAINGSHLIGQVNAIAPGIVAIAKRAQALGSKHSSIVRANHRGGF